MLIAILWKPKVHGCGVIDLAQVSSKAILPVRDSFRCKLVFFSKEQYHLQIVVICQCDWLNKDAS